MLQPLEPGHGGAPQRQHEQFSFHRSSFLMVIEDAIYVLYMFIKIRDAIVSLQLRQFLKNVRDRILLYISGDGTLAVDLVMELWRVILLPLMDLAWGRVFHSMEA